MNQSKLQMAVDTTFAGIRHSDVLNVIRSLLAPVVFVAPYFWGVPHGFELLAALAVFMVIGYSNYLLHLHIHHPFTRHRGLNLALDLALGSVTAMTASNWRIQHLYGHHRGIDTSFRGGSDWELEQYSPLRALSFCARSIGPTFWRPVVVSFQKGVLASVRRPINYRWAFAEHVLLFGWIAVLAWIDLRLTLLYALPIYLLTYVITRYIDYLNHYGCHEHSPNRLDHANNCLSSWFNRITHNFGYHTAHHLRPGAHWTELPGIYADIADQIPAARKTSVSWNFVFVPYHVYLSLRGHM